MARIKLLRDLATIGFGCVDYFSVGVEVLVFLFLYNWRLCVTV